MLQRLRLLCVLISLACFISASALSQDTWTGQAQCQLSVQSQGFVHQEIQTWTLTGSAPTQQGAIQVYPATWSVTGQGGAQRSTLLAQWNNNVPGMNAPLAIFVRASDNRLIIKSWHPQLIAPAGTTAVMQINGTQSSTPAAVSEWIFPQIEADQTQTTVNGAGTINVAGNVVAIPSASSAGTASCKWQFVKGPQSMPVRAADRPTLMSQTTGSTTNSSAAVPQNISTMPSPTRIARNPETPMSPTGGSSNSSPSVDANASPAVYAAPSGSGTTAASTSNQVAVQAPAQIASVGAMNPGANTLITSGSSTPRSSGAHTSLPNTRASVSAAAVTPVALPAPAAFKAESLGDGSVRFNWQAVSGATQYRLDGPGIAAAGLYIPAANPNTTKVVPTAGGGSIPNSALGTRVQNVPLGPGSWHIVAVDSHNSYDPKVASTATTIVRFVPSHAGQWLTKNNGKGSVAQAIAHYISLCPRCAPGATFSDVLTALGISSDALADGNNDACTCLGEGGPCTWTDIHAARYENVTEFGTTRITRCWEALPGNNGPRTVCYSKSGDHGVTVIVKDSDQTWFLTFAWRDDPNNAFSNPAKEVVNWFGAGINMGSNYILTTQVTLDSEGPKSPPHACLSCHGGKFDGARVSGATLLPLDTGLLRVDDRSNGMAANFMQVNQAVLFHGPSPAVQRYLTGLYGGFPSTASGWGDLDYVPQGWKEQSDFYKTAVRPYCMMCHLATPSNLDFSTFGNFAQNKALIQAEVCGGHTMPHAEYPFKQFWTKDTGNIFLPGYLAAGVGISSCQ